MPDTKKTKATGGWKETLLALRKRIDDALTPAPKAPKPRPTPKPPEDDPLEQEIKSIDDESVSSDPLYLAEGLRRRRSAVRNLTAGEGSKAMRNK